MKVGDLVEVNFDTNEAALVAVVVGKHKTRARWANVRFVDGPRNFGFGHHSYPWRNLRLISEA